MKQIPMSGKARLIFLVLFLAIAPAFAAHNANFSLSPNYVYPGEPKIIVFSANTSGHPLASFSVDLSNFVGSYSNISCSVNWSLYLAGNLSRCYNGTGSSVNMTFIYLNFTSSYDPVTFTATTSDIYNSTNSSQLSLKVYTAGLSLQTMSRYNSSYLDYNTTNRLQQKTYYFFFNNTGTDNVTYVNGTLANMTIDGIYPVTVPGWQLGSITYGTANCTTLSSSAFACTIPSGAQAYFAIVMNATAANVSGVGSFRFTSDFQRGAQRNYTVNTMIQTPASVTVIFWGVGDVAEAGARAVLFFLYNSGEEAVKNFYSRMSLVNCTNGQSYPLASIHLERIPGGYSTMSVDDSNYTEVPQVNTSCISTINISGSKENTGVGLVVENITGDKNVTVKTFRFSKHYSPSVLNAGQPTRFFLNITNTGNSTLKKIDIYNAGLPFSDVQAAGINCSIDSFGWADCTGNVTGGSTANLTINLTTPASPSVRNITIDVWGETLFYKRDSFNISIQAAASSLNLTQGSLNTPKAGTGKNFVALKANFTHGDAVAGANAIRVSNISLRFEKNDSSLVTAWTVDHVIVRSGSTSYFDGNVSSSSPNLNLTTPINLAAASAKEIEFVLFVASDATPITFRTVFLASAVPAYDAISGNLIPVYPQNTNFTSNYTSIVKVAKLSTSAKIGLPSAVYRGQKGVSMTFEVENQGQITANNVVLTITMKDSGGNSISTTNVTPRESTIYGGNKTDYVVLFNIPDTAALGTITVELTATGEDETYSVAVTSNQATTTSVVNRELSIEPPTSVVKIAKGASETISVNVKNDGTETQTNVSVEIGGGCCTLRASPQAFDISPGTQQIVVVTVAPKDSQTVGSTGLINFTVFKGRRVINSNTFTIEVGAAGASCANITQKCSDKMPCCQKEWSCTDGVCAASAQSLALKTKAQTAYSNAEMRIKNIKQVVLRAETEGKDTTDAKSALAQAQALLDQAKDKIDFGDYENANQLATQAEQKAIDAEKLMVVPEPATDYATIGAVIAVLLGVGAIGYYFMSRPKVLPAASQPPIQSSWGQATAQPQGNSYYAQRQPGQAQYSQMYKNVPQYGQAQMTPQQKAYYQKYWQQYRNYYAQNAQKKAPQGPKITFGQEGR